MGKNVVETSCFIVEISCGGIRFLNQNSLGLNDQVLVEVSLSEEKQPLTLQGQVKWCDLHSGKSYRYQTGVQFNPYGQKKGQNAPEILKQLKSLEEKFIKKE